MYPLVTLVVLTLVAAVTSNPAKPYNDFPIIETDIGTVQGFTIESGRFARYFGFKGIPYGEPPVGDLRFRAPVPHRGWEGVRDASEHGNNCPSGSFLGEYSGNEDCLFLNIYTTNLLGKRPVMVWIHGGSFSGGSGDSFIYGADHLVQEDVLVVTINYRLGALGFMSTGDKHAPGNAGMKDMILALQWIQRNILNFGGDPEQVTIFGQSAGGVAVHYLVLSPLSQGLFSKAISQSGSALNPWAFAIDPISWAWELADIVGVTASNTEELVARFRELPASVFVNANPGWLDLEIPRGFRPMAFVPSIDAPDSEEPIFLPRHPLELMESGDFNHIPYMTGFLDADSLFIVYESRLDSTVIDQLISKEYAKIPYAWNVTEGTPEAAQIAQEFRDFYLNGEQLNEDNLWEWSKYTTDHHFGYGIDRAAKLHAENQEEPVYYYIFSFVGDLNLVKRGLLLTDLPGAVHGDEIVYLFSVTNNNLPMLPSNSALLTRRRMTKMWSNFAKTGNPTSEKNNDVNVDWLPISGAQEYLEIGSDLVFGRNLHMERMALWHRLRETYTNN